jgi:hypothetical protein
MITIPLRGAARALTVCAIGLGLAGCGSIRIGNSEEAQAVVTSQLVGMSVGDFIERYGAPRLRDNAPDGTLSFNWQSSVGSVPAGPQNLDDRVCQLRISADRFGRIVSAQIRQDALGRTSTSRCGEMFK